MADLTSEAFIASLRRFTALYGVPCHIYSDNGSNFVGAHKELSSLRDLLLAVLQLCLTKDLQWHFSPSRDPDFGGLWEAAVKAMKALLRKVVGAHVLRTDKMQNLLLEASAILNSRLLAPLDSQSSDGVEPLTSGHFLHVALLPYPMILQQHHHKLTVNAGG